MALKINKTLQSKFSDSIQGKYNIKLKTAISFNLIGWLGKYQKHSSEPFKINRNLCLLCMYDMFLIHFISLVRIENYSCLYF